jgi:hypothetical protein
MVSRVFRRFALGAAALAAVACQDATGTSSSDLAASALNAALSSVPVGYGDLSTSYVGTLTASAGTAGLWITGGREASFDRGELMGGGLNDAFAGSIGFAGRGGNHGPFGGAFGGGLNCTGTFDAASGRVTCPTETRNGVTSVRSARYTTTAGAVQQAFDTLTTNSVNVQSAVSGTIVYNRAADSASAGDHGSEHWGRGRGPGGRLLGDTATVLTASTTVKSSSTRTVTGLAAGSTLRAINGSSAGQENSTGTSTRGSFTAARTVGDTTTGLVIPVATGTTSYPTAGTVIRSIRASLTYAGAAAVSLVRREVITYDGSATAKIVITKDGVTQNCTRALPRGQLVCS